MPEFLTLIPPADALRKVLSALPEKRNPAAERIPTEQALGRTLAAPVTAPESLPPFRRTTVDGYAVRAADTFGATLSLPAYLAVVGEIEMGTASSNAVGAGEAVLIHTGGMIPEGADSVVMVEDTQRASGDRLEVYRPTAPGQNVLEAGEDVGSGEIVLQAGQRLRPQEIGGLMALGVLEVEAALPPKAAIISSGNEIVEPGEELRQGEVRDVNSYTLAALIEQAGGESQLMGIIPDELDDLAAAIQQAHRETDLIIVTAGSSVSVRDHTAAAFGQLGPPGILVHGLAVRPGRPTILGVAGEIPFCGLPGNPVSALVIADLLMTPLIHHLLGRREPILRPSVVARAAVNLPSESGREEYIPVRLEMDDQGWVAQPVYGRSNLIFSLIRADGLAHIPAHASGVAEGEPVRVRLFE